MGFVFCAWGRLAEQMFFGHQTLKFPHQTTAYQCALGSLFISQDKKLMGSWELCNYSHKVLEAAFHG